MEKRAGFTLIELLVVISIIVILLAILMPSLQRVRNNARAVACQSNLKQFGTLFEMHVENNQGRLFYGTGQLLPDMNDFFLIDFEDISEEYNSKIRFCPMAVRKGNRPFPDMIETGTWFGGTPFFGRGTSGSTFESWSLDLPWNWDSNSPGGTKTGSYGINHALGGLLFLAFKDRKLRWDEFAAYSAKGQSNIPVYLDSTLPASIFVWEGQKPPVNEDETSCCINRHDGGVNCLFLDWSVRKVGPKELWKLKWTPTFNTNGPWTSAGGVKPEDWPQWMREFKDY